MHNREIINDGLNFIVRIKKQWGLRDDVISCLTTQGLSVCFLPSNDRMWALPA